jgi:hypothetical protein
MILTPKGVSSRFFFVTMLKSFWTGKNKTQMIEKLTPAAPKSWLYTVAGLMWSGVGIFLCSLTVEWLSPVKVVPQLLLIGGGIALAVLIYRFGFSKFADKNIERITIIPKPKVCIFAFQQ